MIPLANSGALWKEPKSVALRATRIVIAETAPGVWEFMPIAEAQAYGGAIAVLEETAPGVFEPVALTDADPTAARVTGVHIGTTAHF